MIERIEVDQKSYDALVSALRKEEDGKELARDFVKMLTVAVSPAAEEAKTAILSMSSAHESTDGAKLRPAVASRVSVRIRLGGSSPGVFIRAGKSGMPRGFHNAPKRLNARKWRHKVYGNPEVWVDQVGQPGWFDDTIARYRPAAIRAAERAMDRMAKRISDRTRG